MSSPNMKELHKYGTVKNHRMIQWRRLSYMEINCSKLLKINLLKVIKSESHKLDSEKKMDFGILKLMLIDSKLNFNAFLRVLLIFTV